MDHFGVREAEDKAGHGIAAASRDNAARRGREQCPAVRLALSIDPEPLSSTHSCPSLDVTRRRPRCKFMRHEHWMHSVKNASRLLQQLTAVWAVKKWLTLCLRMHFSSVKPEHTHPQWKLRKRRLVMNLCIYHARLCLSICWKVYIIYS